MANGPGSGGSRRKQSQYTPQYHQQHMAPMYANYMSYAPQQYYGMPPPQYPNGAMPSPAYMPYQAYGRSPQPMHQYVPMVGVSVPSNYPRPTQQSPNLATSYQPPPPPVSIQPQTPSSTHSSQMIPPPTPPTPQAVQRVLPQSQPQLTQLSELTTPVIVPDQEPFRPPLPWLSKPETPFPRRSRRSKAKRKLLPADGRAVSLPVEQHGSVTDSTTATAPQAAPSEAEPPSNIVIAPSSKSTAEPHAGSQLSESNISQTSNVPADAMPSLHKPAPDELGAQMTSDHIAHSAVNGEVITMDADNTTTGNDGATGQQAAPALPVKAAPTSWANLFSKPAIRNVTASNGALSVNGDSVETTTASAVPGSSLFQANRSFLAEAIRSFKVERTDRATLIEPRGLVNTGNMCYMNSVLQVLMFCAPFYDFLDQVSQRAAHSFKSETPLVDAMVMFLQEFKVLATASSSEQLRKTLKSHTFELYGEPFTPELVYEALRQLPRFASMRRGHQQDAEEFLGFLLQSLDDECTLVMNKFGSREVEQILHDASAHHDSATSCGDWLEVGRKQKAAVSRSIESTTSSPVTKIFGGLLRSEFRVPGLKDSITTEPYQPLQLDIGSPDVRNVVDALRRLTRPERLQGDFNSPRGKNVMATKQVFIESLPPVLILHLKRFQFDATVNGTIKIWKKIGYPLELEIPREALSRQRRQSVGDGIMPRYKLISVVYHHGKNASGGHYTVDVRRQDGQEWIRLDDTVPRRIRSEEVAESGAEEGVKDGSSKQSVSANSSTNRFGPMNYDGTRGEDGWKQVTTSANGNKKWSSVLDDANTASEEKYNRDNIKDSKVAYLLFYQRM
ncbi:hypothetical protein ED733_004219 [Metarhizium rileyi]|uniref:Ubiquitin carboxyl-terminal hydrolase n=1 Tax=Metarhizium rileyi (strain RCEF 4871) TaxID=1649241 RepID=A0A5C6G5T2_METRR|nr:hypothetical protein ED733_004219 [Metarhizium rileyi]